MLQCVARGVVCCSVLQCVAVCCNVLQCVAICCSVLQCVAVCCSMLQCVAMSLTTFFPDPVLVCDLQCVAVCCSMFLGVIFNALRTLLIVLLFLSVVLCCSVLQCVVVHY